MLSIVSFPTYLWQFLSDTTEGSDSTIKITNDPWKETDFPHKQSFLRPPAVKELVGLEKKTQHIVHFTSYS